MDKDTQHSKNNFPQLHVCDLILKIPQIFTHNNLDRSPEGMLNEKTTNFNSLQSIRLPLYITSLNNEIIEIEDRASYLGLVSGVLGDGSRNEAGESN